jgi:hypothetical protein
MKPKRKKPNTKTEAGLIERDVKKGWVAFCEKHGITRKRWSVNRRANLKRLKTTTASSLERVFGRLNLVLLVGEAMQDVWNDHVGDCGTVPDCFELAGRNPKLTCEFTGSQFALSVARRIEWLATQPPNAPSSATRRP